MTTELTIKLLRPHPAQEQVIHDASRFNVLVCGRRWGKTELLINRLVRPILEGKPVGWFAPNEKYFDEVWRETNRILDPIITRSDAQKKRLELLTGGVADFWTLHNTDDPGRGRKYAAIAIDEAAIIPSHRLERQWTEAIRPTLTDYRGDAWFASTPKGAGYFKDLYDRAQVEDNWRAWQMPTTANPHISVEEVQEAKEELPRLVFAQEYEAEFVTEFGAVFKPPQRYEELPKSGFTEATGCDFAYTSKAGDWTVFIEGRMVDEKIYLTGAYRKQAEVVEWSEALREYPNPFALIGGQEKGIAQLLAREGVKLETRPAQVDKLARAQPAIAAWNKGQILVPQSAPWLDDVLTEVLAFTGDPKVDVHDDAVDALAALHIALARPNMTSLTKLRSAIGAGRVGKGR